MQNQGGEWKKQYDALVQGKLERLRTMSPEEKRNFESSVLISSSRPRGRLAKIPPVRAPSGWSVVTLSFSERLL